VAEVPCLLATGQEPVAFFAVLENAVEVAILDLLSPVEEGFQVVPVDGRVERTAHHVTVEGRPRPAELACGAEHACPGKAFFGEVARKEDEAGSENSETETYRVGEEASPSLTHGTLATRRRT